MILGIAQYNVGVDGNSKRPWDGAKGGYVFVTFVLNDPAYVIKSYAMSDGPTSGAPSEWVHPDHATSFLLELVY